MPRTIREIAIARRELAAKIADDFLPLEESAHATATKAARCVASLLDGHAAAALPPMAGQEIIDLVSEAARLAALSRASIMKAHSLMQPAAAELGIDFVSDPDCPPNTGEEKQPLRIVA